MSRLISIVGTPSPTLYAATNVLRLLTQTAVGDHVVVVANSLEVLRREFSSPLTRNGQPVVLFSDYPEPDILAILYQLNAPVAICVDDLTRIAHYSVVSRDYGGVEAARFALRGLVNVEPATVSPPGLSLVVNDPNTTLARLIGDLAALYRLPMENDSLAKVLALLGHAEQGEVTLGQYAATVLAVDRNAREILERRSPLENELIDFLALQYDGIARGRRLEKLEWPVYALLRPEFPDHLTIGPIDLVGPARFVYHGPYFALPVGAWSADITLEVNECFSNDPVEIDVTARVVLATIRMKLPRNGVYSCQIHFQIEDPSQLVEIRLRLLTGAIEGVIRMQAIVLQRISASCEAESAAETHKAPSIGP